MVAIKKKGLGRGLEALLGEKTQNEGSSAAINRLPLTVLQAGKYQPRQKMEAGALQELAESIREQGVMQPLLVRLVSPGKYEIIAGERRFRAASIAGLKEVPVLVSGADDQAAAAMALVDMGHARALLPLPGASQVALAQKIASQGLSVREAERMSAALAIAGGQIGDKKSKSAVASAGGRDPDTRRLAQEMADLIGLNVQFKFKGKGGEIRIGFSQFDELDSLLKKLGIAAD